MSTWFDAEFVCPACQTSFITRLARGVNIGRAPELRTRALRGELNQPRCTACNAVIVPDVPLVYSDPSRGEWVVVAQPSDLATWRQSEAVALAGLRTTIGTASPALPTARLRVVFDIDELREKLVIWEAGLDDGVVECIKLACLREMPAICERGERIRALDLSDPSLIAFGAAPAGRPRHVRTRWSAPRTLADVETYRERFPDLFAPGFVSLDRYFSDGSSLPG